MLIRTVGPGAIHLHTDGTIVRTNNNGEREWKLSEPQIKATLVEDLRDKFPSALSDLFAMLLYAQDSGAEGLPITAHPLPQTLTTTSEIKNIVLIIGESETPYAMSAYGYPLQTTPFLDKNLQTGQACLLQKAHAAANQTRNAVLPSLSLWTPDNIDAAVDQINFVELAHQKNYRTAWLSSQEETGFYAGVSGHIRKYADYFSDMNQGFSFSGKTVNTPNDNALLPAFEALLQQQEDKNFFVLHLSGSHAPYWNKDKEDRLSLPNASDYDQTVHKTDRILEKIYQLASQNLKDPLIIYVSDHGEGVPWGEGHTQLLGANDYPIPLSITGTKAAKTCHYLETLRSNNGWYNSNMNKFLLLHLLGEDADQKWITKERNPDLIRHIDGKIYEWGTLPKQNTQTIPKML